MNRVNLVGKQFTDLFVKAYAGSNGRRSLWVSGTIKVKIGG